MGSNVVFRFPVFRIIFLSTAVLALIHAGGCKDRYHEDLGHGEVHCTSLAYFQLSRGLG